MIVHLFVSWDLSLFVGLRIEHNMENSCAWVLTFLEGRKVSDSKVERSREKGKSSHSFQL